MIKANGTFLNNVIFVDGNSGLNLMAAFEKKKN